MKKKQISINLSSLIQSEAFNNLFLLHNIKTRQTLLIKQSIDYLINKCTTVEDLDDLLIKLNIGYNSNKEDFLNFLYFIDPTYKKLNPYKKGIIEELELPEKTPKEKTIEKSKETPPFMQVTLGNKTFLNQQQMR